MLVISWGITHGESSTLNLEPVMCPAAEPAEPDIMERPPRRPGKRLLGKLILWRCAFVSGLLVILVLGMYGGCTYVLWQRCVWSKLEI